MPNKETRRLAAVMFADITGYTAMVQKNEAEALAKVDIHRSSLKKYTNDFGGEVIAFYGDGSLSTYPSAVAAVQCAMAMQSEYLNRDVPVRIGIHFGDIVYKDGTIYGDGVNMASRIESEGIPGAILISVTLKEELSQNPEISTKSLGHFNLKNVKKPIELFAITNAGLEVPSGSKQRGKLWRAMSYLGVSLTVLFMVGYILNETGLLKNMLWDEAGLKQEKIAVRFVDLANVAEIEQLPLMASHWIGNRIEEVQGSQVVKYEASLIEPGVSLATVGTSKRLKFARETGAANLLEGQIFRDGDSLIFDAQIIDLATGNSKHKFRKITCAIKDPMVGIHAITNEIRGWWVSKDLKLTSPPNYASYKAYLAARDLWTVDDEQSKAKLLDAIALDPTFIDPYFLLLVYFDNESLYPKRDSMLNVIEQNFSHLNPRLTNLFKIYSAGAKGDLVGAYTYFLNELQVDSLDFFANTGGMVAALKMNLPGKAIELYKLLPVDKIDLQNCGYCNTRFRMAITAYLEMDSVDQALSVIPLFEYNSTSNETAFTNATYQIQAYAKSNNYQAVQTLISNLNQKYEATGGNQWIEAGRDFKLNGEIENAELCAQNILSNKSLHSEYIAFEAQYLLGNYGGIENNARKWLEQYNTNQWVLSYASRVFAHTGNQDDLNQVLEALDKADENDDYDYGFYTYYKGVIAAISGDHDKAIDLLELAYKQGHFFNRLYYQLDVDLAPLFEHPRFQKLLHPIPNKLSAF